MKYIHTPKVNARYWTAITLASVFGTNMGDFYAHESGFGILKGLALLTLLTTAVFVAERLESRCHEAYYWLVIILIRTAATNIADYLAFRVRVPEVVLSFTLMALLVLFGWATHLASRNQNDLSPALPKTNGFYWLAMLTAGVFGTVLGDISEHAVGEGAAAIILSVTLVVVLFAGRRRASQFIALYWFTVAVARTAGTAIGDWLAENKSINIGLPLCTLLSGLAFVAVLILWPSRSKENSTMFGGASDAV